MTAAVRSVVDAVLGLARVEPPEVESVLGVKLARVGNALPSVEHYEGVLPSGPFGKVDFRINRKTGLAFLALPSLFLRQFPSAADTLAAAVRDWRESILCSVDRRHVGQPT